MKKAVGESVNVLLRKFIWTDKGLTVQIYQNKNCTQKSKLWKTYCIEPILDSKTQLGTSLV